MTSLQKGTAVLRAVAAAATLLFIAPNATAREIQGSGSSFVAPVMYKWAERYAKSGGTKVKYQSVGSGAGIQQIETGAVDFGATDMPLDPVQVARFGLCQFPIVIGAIVPVINLPGVPQGKIKFSGKLLADIFIGRVKQWDDPAIRSINGDLNLPHMPIRVVHRLDGSGTTYNWVSFLARSSNEWKQKLGVGLTVKWPTGIAAKGNEGVTANVRQIPGTIGYVEFAYAWQNNLTYGQVQNAWGLFVEPMVASFEINAAKIFGANASAMDWERQPDFNLLMTNVGGPFGYPIVAATFILVPASSRDRGRGTATLAFLKWALENGEQEAAELHYIALPPNLILLIERYWKSHSKAAT